MLWAAIILVFTIWVAAWQLMRARERRQDDASRLAARRRLRARDTRSSAGDAATESESDT
jgi:hypothetical protein